MAYYGVTEEEAVIETLDLRHSLRGVLLEKKTSLDNIFVNLHNRRGLELVLPKRKAKRRWLRLYALKIDAGGYVLTGGCIKLTHLMEDKRHTSAELAKQDRCRRYLKENGVFDDDSFIEFMEMDF